MLIRLKDEEIAHVVREFRERIYPRITRAIIPLYEAVEDGDRVQTGTGALFAVAGERFIVTAAHVCADFFDRKTALLTADIDGGESLVFVEYDWAKAAGEFDVAAIRLGPAGAAALANREPLTMADIDSSRNAVESALLFAAVGFPCAWQKRDRAAMTIAVSPHTLLCHPYEGSVEYFSEFNPAANFAIEVAEDDSLQPSGERSVTPPQLNGISGCPVWRLALRSDTTLHRVSLERTRVIGVETGTYHRDRILKATTWAAALHLIERNCPDVAPALRLRLLKPS